MVLGPWKGPARIVKSNSCPCTGQPQIYTISLRGLSKCFLNSIRLGAVTASLGSLSQCSTTLWLKEPLPNTQPKRPLAHLPAIPSGPVIGHQREEISACPSSSPWEAAVDRNEVSPQSPPLQVEQTK